ncbi:hypothetical protein KAT51_04170 [bacterium]|nr:hypothetical protein [bacterium]
MIKKIVLELWDIFKYFSHLNVMRFCDEYERYYPEKKWDYKLDGIKKTRGET